MAKPYAEGRTAAQSGVGSNPYPAGSRDSDDWENGFFEANLEKELKRRGSSSGSDE
jgi:hypothetical protein